MYRSVADSDRVAELPVIVVKHVVAVGVALLHSVRHLRALAVRLSEWRRYFAKSTNLALCYVGFCAEGSYRQAIRAGRAASLCCAYDVVTDWRLFDDRFRKALKTILSKEVNPELAELALSLYGKESGGSLLDDGLERGVVALQFVTSLIGSKETFRDRTDLRSLGMLCQIADDILDYESDIRRNELNCLASSKRDQYLEFFLTEMTEEEIDRLFPNGPALSFVLRRARSRARMMLAAANADALMGGKAS